MNGYVPLTDQYAVRPEEDPLDDVLGLRRKTLQRKILQAVQDMENEGYQFEAADASFELLIREVIGGHEWTADRRVHAEHLEEVTRYSAGADNLRLAVARDTQSRENGRADVLKGGVDLPCSRSGLPF